VQERAWSGYSASPNASSSQRRTQGQCVRLDESLGSRRKRVNALQARPPTGLVSWSRLAWPPRHAGRPVPGLPITNGVLPRCQLVAVSCVMQLGGFRATSGRRSEWHLRWLGGMYAPPPPLSDGPFSPAGAPTTGNPGDPRRTSYATSIPRLLSPPFYHENNGLADSHEAVLRSLMHTRLSGSSQNASSNAALDLCTPRESSA
jgi:hypothetical protein